MTELIRGKRNTQMYSWAYKIFRILGFINLEKVRNNYLSGLKGKILDIGVGDAGNYRYYSRNAKITVLDFEKNMLDYAKKSIPKKSLKNYRLVHGNAQKLSHLKSNYFDAVVVIFIYCCSVPDSIKAIKEAKRVLKKNGELIVIAHVKSKSRILYFFQLIMQPFSRWLINSDMTRDTEEHNKKAGFNIINKEITGGYDIFNVFICKK